MIDRAPRRAAVAAAVLGGLLGAAWFGLDRATTSARPAGPPGTRLVGVDRDPVPRQGSAREQYRYAQLVSDPFEQRAAWLAVPRNFPDDPRGWVDRSYAQLGMNLYRHGDSARLRALADELESLPEDRRPVDAGSLALLRSAAAVLEGDPQLAFRAMPGPGGAAPEAPWIWFALEQLDDIRAGIDQADALTRQVGERRDAFRELL